MQYHRGKDKSFKFLLLQNSYILCNFGTWCTVSAHAKNTAQWCTISVCAKNMVGAYITVLHTE